VTTLARVFVSWTGWEGAPGVNVLHYSPGTIGTWDEENVQGLVDEVSTCFLAMRDIWQVGIDAEVETTVRLIDDATGTLTGIITAPTAPGAIGGTGTGDSVSRATMVCAQFRTSDFLRGRQLRGRCFIGPVAAGAIASDGSVASAARSAVNGAFAASLSGIGPRLCVWSRPPAGDPSGGSYGDVVQVGTMSVPAVLRSRRD
jgi:hypothetical protein